MTAHHDTSDEVWIRIAKRDPGSRRSSRTKRSRSPLCFGWIDSNRRSLNETHYLQRYSPRRRGSNWSEINIARAECLIDTDRMRPAGLTEFEKHHQKGK